MFSLHVKKTALIFSTMEEYRPPANRASGRNSPQALLYFSLHWAGEQASKANAAPEKHISRQFACGHRGFKSDDHHKCLSCRTLQSSLCSKSLACDICESWDTLMWDYYLGKLQILWIEKAVSWQSQTLSDINLVV